MTTVTCDECGSKMPERGNRTVIPTSVKRYQGSAINNNLELEIRPYNPQSEDLCDRDLCENCLIRAVLAVAKQRNLEL